MTSCESNNFHKPLFCLADIHFISNQELLWYARDLAVLLGEPNDCFKTMIVETLKCSTWEMHYNIAVL